MLSYHFYLVLWQLLNGVLLTQTQVTGGGGVGETDEMITELAADILGKVPKPFDVRAVSERYPVLYANSMNTVLRQVSYQNGGSSFTFMFPPHSLCSYICRCPANTPSKQPCIPLKVLILLQFSCLEPVRYYRLCISEYLLRLLSTASHYH